MQQIYYLCGEKQPCRMKKIGLLSDTHGYWDDKYLYYFEPCDEIWHAGDIGYHLRAGSHYLSREDWQKFAAYMQKHKNA